MRPEQAIAVVRNFRRYRVGKRGKTQWYQAGPYTPNIIPKITKAQDKRLYAVMGTKNKLGAVRWIDTARLRSTQHCLRFKSLMWNVKNRDRMQKTFGRNKRDLDVYGVNLPIVTWVDGVPIIWNGNHRAVANILLGHKRILVRMFKLRPGYRVVMKRKPRGR